MIEEFDAVDPYGFIYITTNMVNGKRYIGQKKFDGESRWKSYLGSGYHLLKSIKKYGKEQFVRNIVCVTYSEEECNEKECEWITLYNAVEDDDYYNMIDGGLPIDAISRRNSKPIICIDNNLVFKSMADASVFSGYAHKKIKNSFNKVHSNKKYREEDFIFRPYIKLNKNEKLCCVCGEKFEKDVGNQKRCRKCIGYDLKIKNKTNKKKRGVSVLA